MTSLAARAEVIKLARTLDVDPKEIDFLRTAPPENIRAFRRATTTALDAPFRTFTSRLAKAGTLLPSAVAAKIATAFFGPMLSGSIVSELPPGKAAALIGHVPLDFLADTAQYLDPDAAAPLVRALDSRTMVPIMQELLRRGDHVTVARFVNAVTDRQLREVIPLVTSGDDLLLTALNVESGQRLDAILTALPDDRIRDLLRAAQQRDLFGEATPLLAALTPATLARLTDLAAELGPDVSDGLAAANSALLGG